MKSRRVCLAWFGEGGGGGTTIPQTTPIISLTHDGQKWSIKRNGKTLAVSRATFEDPGRLSVDAAQA
jgi:hypothetical protein